MSAPVDLPTLRAELKHKLASGVYDPLAERVLRFPHKIFPRLPKGDLASLLILSSIHILLAYLLDFSDGVEVLREWILIAPISIFLFWLGIFLCVRLHLHLYRVLSDYVIDALTQPKDLRDLGLWLGRFNSPMWTLFFAVIFFALIMPYHYPIQTAIHGALGVRTSISLASGYFLIGVAEYLLITLMLLPLILSRYHIDLYEIDPNLSPSIRQLSTVIRDSAYLLSVYAAIFTFFMVYTQIPLFPTALLTILPLSGIFIFRQIALSRIIARARDVTLDRLRQRIEALEIEQHFDNPALCSQFKAMADYYDNVKNAETGVFDLRTGLLLLNSLLLPTTAFLLTQFDRIRAFLGW